MHRLKYCKLWGRVKQKIYVEKIYNIDSRNNKNFKTRFDFSFVLTFSKNN